MTAKATPSAKAKRPMGSETEVMRTAAKTNNAPVATMLRPFLMAKSKTLAAF